MFTQTGVWARSTLFCTLGGSSFVTPTVNTLTLLIAIQAFLWLVFQLYGFRNYKGGKIPMAIEHEDVPREAINNAKYYDIKDDMKEEIKQ